MTLQKSMENTFCYDGMILRYPEPAFPTLGLRYRPLVPKEHPRQGGHEQHPERDRRHQHEPAPPPPALAQSCVLFRGGIIVTPDPKQAMVLG